MKMTNSVEKAVSLLGQTVVEVITDNSTWYHDEDGNPVCTGARLVFESGVEISLDDFGESGWGIE